MLALHKIGNYNNNECLQNENIAKISLPNLTQVYYEKNSENKNFNNIKIYNFIDKFFYINKFLKYEGFDDNNNIIIKLIKTPNDMTFIYSIYQFFVNKQKKIKDF